MEDYFEVGRLAAEQGLKVADNPHKSMSAFAREEIINYKQWLDGYLSFHGHNFKDEDEQS